jgi:hypothetical protein
MECDMEPWLVEALFFVVAWGMAWLIVPWFIVLWFIVPWFIVPWFMAAWLIAAGAGLCAKAVAGTAMRAAVRATGASRFMNAPRCGWGSAA